MGAHPAGPAGSAISMYINLPQGGAGHLSIDPAGVEAFVKYLEQAQLKLQEIRNKGRWLVHVEPPGNDPFSPIAVADIERTAGHESGGHLYANERAQQVFQAIINNLRASLEAYRATEAGNADKFKDNT